MSRRMRWRAALLALALGLTGWVAARPAKADDATAARAGALLGTMKEAVQAHRDAQYKRPPLDAQSRAAAAQRLARSLARQRDDLARLAPQAQAGSRFAADLARFLEHFPDEAAIRANLLDDSWGERLATDLTGLWFQAADKRSTWKTPFPVFRP